MSMKHVKPKEPKNPILREYQRLKNRIVWSWKGLQDTYVSEPSFRSWVYANIVSAALALWLPISSFSSLVIIVLGILVLVSELFNTAIESAVDLTTDEYHELAAKATAAGSAGVAVTAISAGVAWIYAIYHLIF